jgi:hypothetical protein
MYFNIDRRNLEYRNKLMAFIQKNYYLKIVSMNEHNRGFYGETWKIECNNNCNYFVKIIYFERHAKKYRKCFQILDYMEKNGIDFVSKVIKSNNNKPYLCFNEGTLAIFKFIDGVHAEDTPATFTSDIIKIYKLPKPNFKIERENFPTNIFSYLEQQIEKLKSDIEILNIINKNWDLLIDVNNKQNFFANLCKNKEQKFVITSGDIGGNTLIANNKIYVIDWDWIKLAPPERDYWWYVQNLNLITEINVLFHRYNFDYSLDSNILGYYAFSLYIYYLTEIIDSFLFNPISRPEVIKRLNDYFTEENCMLKCMENIKQNNNLNK